MAKPSDTGQDLIGGFSPDEGPRSFVRDAEVLLDGGAEGTRAAVGAAPNLFLGQGREPPLDEIQPGGAGGGEVQMIARSLGQPPADQWSLVRGVVVQEEVNVQVIRHGRVDDVEELSKFAGTVLRVALADHDPRLDVQRREQRGGAIA